VKAFFIPSFIFSVAIACLFTTIAVTAKAEPRVTFQNSIAPLPTPIAATQRALLAVNQTDAMEFGVALQLRNYPQMQARIARGEIISRQELELVHLPLQADYDAVVQWLTNEGFVITWDDPNRMIVYAQGSIAQVQQSLQVHMVTVTANGGTSYNAADTAPSLPLSIATPVLGINHLQPFHQRRKNAVRQPLTANAPPFKISEILAAYNGTNMGVTGAGQTIAILIDTPAKTTDLTSFWTANGIAQTSSNITVINVNGGTLPAVSGEESLDEQWTSGVAPGAKIRVYASRTLNDADLDKCLQRMITDRLTQTGMNQLSISLGLGETYGTTAQFNTDAQLFATLVSGGMNIFVSSGDGGSTPDSSGGSTGPLQVEHYASDSSVIAVGGTSIFVNSSTGLRTSESTWSGSGGGVSVIFAKPSWQTGTGVPAGSFRCVPDVSFPADPNTGAYVTLNGAVNQYGGTSWSAPTWAGFCALINEARVKAGKPTIGHLNPLVYPLIGTSNFFDITSGNNATSTSGGKYTATVGYDQATGVGSPNMTTLLNTLVAQLPPQPTITSFTPTSGVENTQVVITGANFSSVTGVSFNGTAATFTANSTTQITTRSPAGASTGPINVTTSSGAVTSSASFTVVPGPPAPGITAFSPAYGLVGSNVVITGTNLTGATSVSFNGINATSYTVNSATQITAVVPASATTGAISVTTPSGSATSSTSFVVLTGDGTPTITSFSPNAGAVSSTVTITGTNFVNVIGVTFNGVSVASPTITSPTQITAIVPTGATTGRIVVTTGLGSATSATDFSVGSAPASSLVISQIYGGGGNSSATYTNDFVELYNRGTLAVDITGWSVQYASSTGTSWATTALSGIMQPGRYYLIKLATGGTTGAALPTADATNTAINMSSTRGKVALMNTGTAITSGTSSPVGLTGLIDFVGYGSADAYEGSGPATAPSATLSAIRNGAGATDTGDNAADFSTGTPNARNSSSGGTSTGPDLTITKSHTGNFIQGDTAKTYTITVTNSGNAATSGTVSVTDTLPTGLTATAMSGTGWTTNLTTLTATRSDALAAAGSYPALTITVNVAANATSVTNVASVSGGGETNTANNSASDPTTITTSGGGGSGGTPVVIASWDVSGQSSYGTSPLAAAADPNVTVGGLTRRSGVTTTPTAAARGWGGNGFTATTAAAAVTANTYATFTVTPKTGYTTSFTSLSKFDYRRSASGATSGVFQYQVGSGAFVDVATLSYSSSASAGASIGPIDLSTISALQNIAAGTVVTFRIVSYGATSATGTWYVFDVSNSTAADLALTGIVNPVVTGTPDLALAKTHTGTFTQGDTGKAYALTVTNSGTASTSGTVTVTDTLPSGLSATAFSGTGWTTNLSTLTATRSDALAQGSSYPPLTLTVSVSPSAAASVTNIASVSGGSETNTSNDSASDVTTIAPLTPIQTWRNQWFGNSANSGAGLDTAIAAGDGIPNLLKYALNLTPPQTPATTNGVVVVDSNAGALRLTITKNPAATDLIFSIEGTTNLADPNSWSTTGIVIDQNTSTTLQAHDSAPLTGSPRFLRLKVTRP
jgi:kumamolisin